MFGRPLFLSLALVSSLALFGCQDEPLDHFTAPETFVGGADMSPAPSGQEGAEPVFTQKAPFTVPADILNQGMEAYTNYCFACHGRAGDGRGPASSALRPPPRDFRIATYKFAGVAEGLPTDEALWNLIKAGLHGTAMLEWDVPNKELYAILQYIKTFSPKADGWRDLEFGEIGEAIVAPATDPWAGNEKAAEQRGKDIYHAFAQCHQCHPAYATRMEIYEASLKVGNQPTTEFRDDLYFPEAKRSKSFKVAWEIMEDAPAAAHSEDGHGHGAHHGPSKVAKLVEHDVLILPPDFTFSSIRSGSTPPELFRVIGSGIPGTAMPSWFNAIPDDENLDGNKDLYAMAHYIHALTRLSDKEAQAMRKKMMTQPEFVAPAPADESAKGAKQTEGEAAPAAE